MRTASTELHAWRDEMRALLADDVPPADVMWNAPDGTGALFDAPRANLPATARVPVRFVKLAEAAVLHREPTHAIAYRVLWRLTHGERGLLDDAADADVRTLVLRAKAVDRDVHEMHAFVRFREIDGHYVAWYVPTHDVVERAAPFFVERFASMRWSILTPTRSLAWDGTTLSVLPGVPRSQAPDGDDVEALWRTYYAAVFNPARANPAAMRRHLPARFWPQLPESAEIAGLLAGSAARVDTMIEPPSLARPLPVLREEARACRACELCGPATQTVFGEGPPDASLVLVGEQPGDQEDLAGRPFVGPAGQVLDIALAAAGIARERVYLTNAVKHFRFLPRGKKRLHQRPTADQIRACRPWVVAELQAIAPRVVVCLGATAAHSLVGSRFRVTEERGRPLATRWADHLLATHHPAAILRVDPADRARYEAELAADLRRAYELTTSA